jgi:hypothetical protein
MPIMSRRVLGWTRSAVAGAVATWSSLAAGQAWSVPMGGRTATMGGAGVAEGHDIAMPLLNPAGIAAVDTQVFGLSSSLYSYKKVSVANFLAPNGFNAAFGEAAVDSETFDSSGFSTVPSAVGFFRHLGAERVDQPGHLVVGVAALSPVDTNDTANARLHATLESQNGFVDENVALTERQLDIYVGPVAGLTVLPGVRVGMSVLGLYRSRDLQSALTMTQSIEAGNGFASARTSSSDSATSFGGLAVAGVQVEPLPNVWIGASFQSPSLQFTGSETQSRNESLFLNAPPVTAATNVTDDRSRQLAYMSVEPPRARIGFAYARPSAFTIAADATFVVPYPGSEAASGVSLETETVSGSATRTLQATYSRTIDSLARLDFSVGGEVMLSPNVALRAGYAYEQDPRALPAPGPETAFLTRRDYQTVTAGLGLVIGPFDTTVGLAWQHDSGTIDVEDLFGTAPSTDPTVYPTYGRLDLSGNTFMFMLSGTVTEEQARQQLLERLGAISGPVAQSIEGVEAALQCPSTLDAKAIEAFDYSAAFPGARGGEPARIKAGLLALAELRALASRVEAEVATACAAWAGFLHAPASQYVDVSSACKAAEQATLALTPDSSALAGIRGIKAPACKVDLSKVEACVRECGGSQPKKLCEDEEQSAAGAAVCELSRLHLEVEPACAASCGRRALDAAECTFPEIVDSGAARNLRALMSVAGRLPQDAEAVVQPARALVESLQATARLLQENPESVGAAIACIVQPALSATPATDSIVRSAQHALAVVGAAVSGTQQNLPSGKDPP